MIDKSKFPYVPEYAQKRVLLECADEETAEKILKAANDMYLSLGGNIDNYVDGILFMIRESLGILSLENIQELDENKDSKGKFTGTISGEMGRLSGTFSGSIVGEPAKLYPEGSKGWHITFLGDEGNAER